MKKNATGKNDGIEKIVQVASTLAIEEMPVEEIRAEFVTGTGITPNKKQKG